MPDRLDTIEKQRSKTHLNERSILQSLLLSPSQSLSKIPSLSNMSDLSMDNNNNTSSPTSSSSSSSNASGGDGKVQNQPKRHSWIMNDYDRIDRFSDNYYRRHWGIHKGGVVLSVFLGLVVLISLIVGMAYVR